jgi:hypothetical protein
VLTGTAPQVNQTGYGQVYLNSATFGRPTTLGGTGTGEFVLGVASYTAGLTVDRPTAYQNLGFATFFSPGAVEPADPRLQRSPPSGERVRGGVWRPPRLLPGASL